VPTIDYDDMEQFESRVVEAIDASMEFFNILQYSEQDIKDAAGNITDGGGMITTSLTATSTTGCAGPTA